MKLDVLRRAVAMTLSAGMVLAVPTALPQLAPQMIVSEAQAKAQGVSWDFKKDLDGWKYGGKWAYKGKPEIGQSAQFGGTVRLGVDFSEVADSSWSEVKLECGTAAAKPLDLAGANVVAYVFYFIPAQMTGGQFKTKVYAKDAQGKETINTDIAIDTEHAKDAGNGWKIVPVKVLIPKQEAALTYFMVSVVGSNTDYKGDLFIGKLRASAEKVPDGYVNVKTKVKAQAPVDLAKLDVPAVAPLVDENATPQAARAYAYLKGIASSDMVLYGHQNEMNRKVSRLPGASDTYDIVKDFSGVVGMDALALTGNELELTDEELANGETYATKLARLVLPAARERTRLLLVQD